MIGRRPPPLDFRSDSAGSPDGPTETIDVIVPIHGAVHAFSRCAESLRRHTDFRRHRLIAIVDGAGQSAADRILETLGAEPGARILVLRHERPRGYVASVNRGLRESSDDVVLLNSDAIVTPRWLDKLASAAASSRQVATATPFSNDATLCSIPRAFEANDVPSGFDVPSFARLVEEVSAREYPRIPTGVGFCLYVKRRAIDAVGVFDEAFSPGYGEENDFCFRALKAGWRHVLDDATFVFHEGHRSFGPPDRGRLHRAARLLARRHPEYRETIARFMRDDPLAPARRRVLDRISPPRRTAGPTRPGVVHLVHGWPPHNPAGTEQYARSLAVRQVSDRPTAAFVRVSDRSAAPGEAREWLDGGVRVRLVANDFTQRDPLARNALRNRSLERAFGVFLDETAPALVHVHHLSGHAIGLVREIRRRRIPWVFQVQDWWMACARANLWTFDGRLCPGPGLLRCSRCLPLTGIPPASLWNPVLHAIRRLGARSAFRRANALVMGSRFVETSFRKRGWIGPRQRAHVIGYGVSVDAGHSSRRRANGGEPLRFGVIGSILPHKGIHVAVEAFRGVDPARARLEIWGGAGASPEYDRALEALSSPAVAFRDRFAEDRKNELLSTFDVLIVPSLGLESFGLVAREALRRGVPVIASRRGALEELFPAGSPSAGTLVEPGDPSALRERVEDLIRDPALLERWRAAIPLVKSMDAHVREIDAVYESVLGR